MYVRLDGKLAWLYLMLISQVLIVMIYVVSTPTTEVINVKSQAPVSFVKFTNSKNSKYQTTGRRSKSNFKTSTDSLILKDTKTAKLFRYFNQTKCFASGVNERQMLTSEGSYERCICKPGWHGSDCGQPEVAWRAIMASKQHVDLKLRRANRRIIYIFCLNDFNSDVAEIIVEELHLVVDLFVICDFSSSENNFRHSLTKGLLLAQHQKILYLNAAKVHNLSRGGLFNFIWYKLTHVVKNLKNDDVLAMSESEQIFNSRALMFLKMYDGWPQPIGFRLRWSVFGFYWQHPLKTTIVVGACAIDLVREHVARKESPFLQRQQLETNERDTLGLVLGDLNHYGGWYCHFCQSPANIVNILSIKNITMYNEKAIDIPFVEDLIGGGMWIDGKTSLLRAYRSRELYFAPGVVVNETWKYDWLLDNFYAKLDYY